MDGPLAGATVFACLFSSALAGAAAHARVPGAVRARLAGGLARALVVGLALLAGAVLLSMTLGQKARFDRAGRDVRDFAASLVQFDKTARAAGPEAAALRGTLFRYTVNTIQALWPERGLPKRLPEAEAQEALHQMHAEIARMPAGPAQTQNAEALRRAELAGNVVRAQAKGRSSPLLTGFVLACLMLTFAGLGLWARPGRSRTATGEATHAGALAALFLGAVVLGGAIFLMQEYSDPFAGVIVVSHESLQNALFEISE